MVYLVRARVGEILTLDIQLYARAKFVGQSFEMGNGGGSALEFLTDFSKFADKLGGLTNRLIGCVDFLHRLFQFFRDIGPTVLAKIAFCVGILVKIVVKIYTVYFHFYYSPFLMVVGWVLDYYACPRHRLDKLAIIIFTSA